MFHSAIIRTFVTELLELADEIANYLQFSTAKSKELSVLKD